MGVLDDKLDVLADLVRSLDERGWTSGGGLDLLQQLRMVSDTAQSAQRQAVDQARAEGASWEQIARALGMTRQSAHERFAS